MLMQFQTFLKDNDFKIFLKYDGERENKIYTVKIFNKQNLNNSLGGNTDTPEELFFQILNELDCENLEDFNVFFTTFREVIQNIKLQYGETSVVSLIADYLDENSNYMLFIANEKKFARCSDTNLQNIISKSKKIALF